MYATTTSVFGIIFGFISEWARVLVPVASISLGISGLCFNILRIAQSKRQIQKRQEDAISELRSLIRRPMLLPRHTQGLVTAGFVRSNAIALSSKHACGEVTIPMMGEAIRWVSLDLQEHFTGPQLKRRLEELNSVLKELDSSMPLLLSLSKSDPVAGYYYGQMYLAALCVAAAGARIG